ncbi:GntR family transcriptional regulator [Paracoccus sp. (in: a-proteobacteria)]|uniref:GntR family transcriptional regulator n=1 Tax=Paracoccus sp. TaxID=267 RepID=UPI0028A7C480|nr:GntR family transcriptional regulator [Paracoccus sp. (in: a-proteobacteria)]
MSDLLTPHAPLKAASLTGQVYDAIAEMLLDGTLKPDSRTSIRELGDHLGVSTMPVREAIGRLIAQGALAIQRNKAVIVPHMTEEDFRDLTRTRVLLESEATRLAVDNMTDETAGKITRLHEEFGSALASEQRANALILNRKLHFTLYDAAKSRSLRQLIGMAWLRAGPMISLDLGGHNSFERASHSVESHTLLVDALQTRDREAAADAIRTDITTASGIILEHLPAFQQERP